MGSFGQKAWDLLPEEFFGCFYGEPLKDPCRTLKQCFLQKEIEIEPSTKNPYFQNDPIKNSLFKECIARTFNSSQKVHTEIILNKQMGGNPDKGNKVGLKQKQTQPGGTEERARRPLK